MEKQKWLQLLLPRDQKFLMAGERRSGKKCRERWRSSARKPDPNLTSFTPQEEDLIIQLHSVLGSRWSIIAQQLQEKTESDVKNVWNSKLKKKLSAMGIDPVTHKPFSQILADYGSVGAFPRGKATRHHPLSSRELFKGEEVVTSPMKAELCDQVEASSFSWNDFFLEEAFAAHENIGEEFGGGGEVLGDGEIGGGFEASSAAFVEAMIGKQDEMCSELPCFYEEPFYY
ncbi:MYB-like transcription factor 4 isoform X2 [Salvia splendens]|uniref:MYB-like transcription factor 4 isoform X2 n=1 Tax=Salvia splendens TaxID=180675 RepID=UPI001C27C960|nr:MYB-like transcription factor 4 isoform X2 [Salvia splendens]